VPNRPGEFIEGFSRLVLPVLKDGAGRYRWAGVYDVTRDDDRAFVVMVRRCAEARMLKGRRYKVGREFPYVGERERVKALRRARSYAKRGRKERKVEKTHAEPF